MRMALAVCLAALCTTPGAAGARRARGRGLEALRNPTSAPGLERRRIAYHGREGTYYVHVPANPRGSAVFVLHGGGGNGVVAERMSDFAAAGDRGGFVTVFPDADGNWNDGRETTADRWADVGFLLAVAKDVEARDHVDAGRLFVTGISNGAMMTLRLACDASADFAAFAVVAGNLPTALEPTCRPSRPVPLLMIHGSADRFVPAAGGEVLHSALLGAGGTVVSTAATVDFWRRADACKGAQRTTVLPDSAHDGTTVVRHVYEGCAPRTEVVFYDVRGGGHTWPGSTAPLRLRITGIVSRNLDATATIVRFFRRHGL